MVVEPHLRAVLGEGEPGLALSPGVPPERISVVYNALPGERPDCPESQGEARRVLGLPDGPLLLTAARLMPLKGIDHSLRALAEHPDARLVIAGDASATPPTATAKKSSSKESSSKTESKPVVHKVAPGETASVIASKYGVKTADLLAANHLTAKSILRVGQSLNINNAARGTSQRDRSSDIQIAEATSKKVVHTVTAGQNPSSIARRYGVSVKDLFKWNNWSDAHVLRIGDEVSIYKD